VRIRTLGVAIGVSLAAPSMLAARFRGARREPLQWSIALAQAMSTYTASHNERMDGTFRSASVQVAKPLFAWRGTTVAWLGEVLPAIVVISEAPPVRIPVAGIDPAANDPAVMARYARKSAFGAGLAPLGAEFSHAAGASGRVILNVTSGGSWFTRVPYGRATQANFTVAPALLYAYHAGARGTLAAGYALHHLSNASMGGANPGMNSHLLTLRWTR
jgi:hypothetical protein